MVSFTAREVRDILISMLVIAVIFAYLINGRNINENLIVLVPALLISVGLGFVLHELAHKFVAVRYGFFAEFKMWLEGLILALAMAFLIGFVFVAPGAVYIHGEHISREQNGKISIAGPVVNILLALFFLGLTPFITKNPSDIWGFVYANIVVYGFIINSILAAFNLLPLGIFDGAKVLRWNPIIWGITFTVSIILAVKAYFGIY
jgi:Zn-dependent protease